MTSQLVELKMITSGDRSFNSMQEVFEHYNTSSLIGLVKATSLRDRVVLICKDAGTGFGFNIGIQKQGASGTWAYGANACSLALMEKL